MGGASYLAQLTQKVGSAANVEFHAKIVAQKYVQRELIRSATEIQRRSYDESTDVTDLIGFAEQEIFKVAEGHVKRSVQSAADVLARTLAQIEENAKNKSAFNGVPSGFMALDRVTMGWQPSDLIIIAARPLDGARRAFTLTMARNMSVDHEQAVAFFSLEMPGAPAHDASGGGRDGHTGQRSQTGPALARTVAPPRIGHPPLGSAKLFIDDTPALSVFEFRSKARRLKIHNDIKIIMIDYLQLMTGGPQAAEGRQPRTGGVVHLAHAQSHRQGAQRPDHRPFAAEPFDRVARRARSGRSCRTCASRAPSSRTPTSWPSYTVPNTTASTRTRTECPRRAWPS